MNKPERIVTFSPAWDKRDSDSAHNYGVHGVELLMVLKSDAGAVQFKLFTNWMLPHVKAELDQKGYDTHPIPADLGYHSKVPRYDGQEPIAATCEWTGGVCYYDGSSLNADRIFETLLNEGSDGVWRELERYYAAMFEGAGDE